MTQTKPKIIVKSDYDHYFENLVQSWVDKKSAAGGHFQHEEIVITADPYRIAAIGYESDGKMIHLDFYAAIRRGFGELTQQDVADIIALL